MKRKLLTALCSALVVAMAVPAFADHVLGGYYRTRMGMSDHSLTKDGNKDPTKLITQRFRMRWQNNLNEYVSVVWYGEINNVFGRRDGLDSGDNREGRYSGGQLGADGVNVQTKQAFASIKIPETPLAATVGLQGFNDNWDGILYDDDSAGVKLGMAMDMVSVTGFYSKFTEGGSTAEDDVDLWVIQVGLKPMGALTVGVDGWWMNDNSGPSSDQYWVGANVGYKMDMVALSGFLVYNFGETGDVDTSAFAASIRGAFSVAGVNAGLRLFYTSGDDDATDKDDNSFGQISRFTFTDSNLMIFMDDLYGTGFLSSGGVAWNTALEYGIWGAILSGSYSPPAMKDLYAKFGLGYLMTVEDDRKAAGTKREGNQLGAELALRVGYKIAGKADVSLNGAIAALGDFYDKRGNAAGDDPDSPYSLYAQLNIPY